MAFLMTLALRLGKTLQQICNQLSAEELFLWQAFDRESPIGDQRADVLAAIGAAASFQAQGAKVTALDLLPAWRLEPPCVEDEEVGEEVLKNYLSERADLQP
uniref:phage tail assembly protein T n=1 Tax=Pseudomonas lundensis TaxID=86185 RepID=UPI0028D3CEC3|nr:phage tail protein [Pseudomonas lundensis]